MSHSAFVLGLAMFSFVMTVIWGMPLLRMLRHFKIGKIIRVEEPDKHRIKMGTPTMGGVLFILPVLLLTGLLNAAALIGLDVTGRSVLIPLIVMVAFGALGARIDHTLGNLALLALPALAALPTCIADGDQTIWLVRDRLVVPTPPGPP